MNGLNEKTAILKVEFPNPTLAQSLLERWSETPGVSLTLRRGRVTAAEARYELEIRGTAETVARIVRQSAPWDAARGFLNPVPVGAGA